MRTLYLFGSTQAANEERWSLTADSSMLKVAFGCKFIFMPGGSGGPGMQKTGRAHIRIKSGDMPWAKCSRARLLAPFPFSYYRILLLGGRRRLYWYLCCYVEKAWLFLLACNLSVDKPAARRPFGYSQVESPHLMKQDLDQLQCLCLVRRARILARLFWSPHERPNKIYLQIFFRDVCNFSRRI